MTKCKKTIAETVGILGLVGLAAMSSQFASAADTGFYVGGNAGWSRADIDTDGITAGLLAGGLTTTSLKDDDREFGYKAFGGYRFMRNFALEGGYFDLGNFGFNAETIPAGTLDGDLEIRGFNLDLVGFLPVTEQFSAFARVGANYGKTNGAFTETGLINVPDPETRDRDTNLKFGFGLQYDFTESFSLRAEAERYRINDTVGNNGDIDLFSLGLTYRFGAKTAAAKPAAYTPEPVADDALALVVVPIAPRRQQYCTILDIQFEINMDKVQREDQEKLGVVGTFMNKYNETIAVIEGHTDNVGSSEQNMSLSQRRAESVVAYLITSFNLSSSRLKAVGYGETRPIADNRTEQGKRQNRRINAVIGCASDVEGLTVDPARVTMALEMEFDTNKSDVRSQYREDLRRVANFIKTRPGLITTVEGHTSNQQGAPSQDMQLSQRRAESVVDYLVREFSVDRANLFAAGFGHTRRTAYNTSTEGQQENRRVNIIFEFPNR